MCVYMCVYMCARACVRAAKGAREGPNPPTISLTCVLVGSSPVVLLENSTTHTRVSPAKGASRLGLANAIAPTPQAGLRTAMPTMPRPCLILLLASTAAE